MKYDLELPDYVENILVYNNDLNEYMSLEHPQLKETKIQDYTQIWYKDNDDNIYSYSYIVHLMLNSNWLKNKRNENHIVCPICMNERCEYDWYSHYCGNFDINGDKR